MMSAHVRTATILLLAVPVLLSAGCLERTERLKLDADGTMTIHLEFETKSFDDLYEGDRLPSVEGGWLVAEDVGRDHQGDEVFTLVADAVYPPGSDLPSSYESPIEADPGVALTFPTTVTFEERDGGVYYHFYRRYASRPWAYLDTAQKLFESRVEELGVEDLETADPSQRRAFIELLAQYETLKYRTFARAAFREVLPSAPQDVWLAVRRAVTESASALDYERIVRILADEDEDTRNKALDTEAKAFEKAVIEAMRRTLVAHGESGQSTAFTRAFKWQIQYYEITQDLGDDAFTITIEMPGEIIAHNADEQARRTVSWRFGGESFRDHELELMVTSFVGF